MSDTKPTILALSSMVAVGHVGLSAIVPTLHLIGRNVAAIPTVVLSNHPGFGRVSGTQTTPDTILAMLDAHEQNGWLSGIETVLTGYLPSAAHVEVADTVVNRVRTLNPAARYCCDPVLGDDPKGLYIDTAAANGIRDKLLPAADILLPNRFELSWLSGRPIASPVDAISAARTLNHPNIIAKSIPKNASEICNIEVTPDTATAVSAPLLVGAPNGTGDMLSGLIAAGWSLARTTAALSAVVHASLSEDHLAIVTAADRWRNAKPQSSQAI